MYSLILVFREVCHFQKLESSPKKRYGLNQCWGSHTFLNMTAGFLVAESIKCHFAQRVLNYLLYQ